MRSIVIGSTVLPKVSDDGLDTAAAWATADANIFWTGISTQLRAIWRAICQALHNSLSVKSPSANSSLASNTLISSGR